MPAPITLFVYNRPDHTEHVISALKNNLLAKESLLYIYSDHAKTAGDEGNVAAVRSYLKKITGFKEVVITERKTNYGLAKSLISGISEIIDSHDEIIVLEDDIVTSPFFIKFMNNALELYRNQQRIISIHGYTYPVNEPLPDTFFLRGADCWGWATWKRGWDLFNPDGKELLEKLDQQNLRYEFDFCGTYPYRKMLRQQVSGGNNSWAIRWYASAFLNNRLTLYPGKSLVHNIGNDGMGTHSSTTNVFDYTIEPNDILLASISVIENIEARKAFSRFLIKTKPYFVQRVLATLMYTLRETFKKT